MNGPLTNLGLGRYRRPAACLVGSVLLLHLHSTPAAAQLLAVNASYQSPSSAPAAESVQLKSLLKQ